MSVITAQVSLYPLRQPDLGPAIRAAWRIFEAHGLAMEQGSMSTVVWGEEGVLMAALRETFERTSAEGEVVMVITLSNACLRRTY